MKIYIGPYRKWVGPYQLAEYILFWKDKCINDADEKSIQKLGDFLDRVPGLTDFCQWIDSKKQRKIKVRIDKYDCWSMDHTLSLIILPMLKKIKENKHGSPYIDDEDVPDNLKSTAALPKKNEWDTDSNHHLRWNWILDQIIWSFEQNLDEDEGRSQYYDPYEEGEEVKVLMPILETAEEARSRGKLNIEKHNAYNQKIAFGLKMFGKYYRGLWT